MKYLDSRKKIEHFCATVISPENNPLDLQASNEVRFRFFGYLESFITEVESSKKNNLSNFLKFC